MNKKGFTLVELLVVVAILGVLAAVGIVSFGGFLGNAKENAVKTNHANMVKFTKSQLLKCTLGDTAMDLVDEQGNARPWNCDTETGMQSYIERFRQHHVGTFSNPYDSELPSGLTNSDCNGQGQTSYTLGENNTLIMKTNFKNGEDCLISQMSLEWWK